MCEIFCLKGKVYNFGFSALLLIWTFLEWSPLTQFVKLSYIQILCVFSYSYYMQRKKEKEKKIYKQMPNKLYIYYT